MKTYFSLLAFVLQTLIANAVYSQTNNSSSCDCAHFSMINPDFEVPHLDSASYSFYDPTEVPGWQTTDSLNKIEIWSNGFLGVPSYHGNNYAELNANSPATMYQDVQTCPGKTYKWQLAHRGREGYDVAKLQVGPPTGPFVTLSSMTDGVAAWGFYQGTYVIPPLQTTTRIRMVPVSNVGPPALPGIGSYGNFIDDFLFTPDYCTSDTAPPVLLCHNDIIVCMNDTVQIIPPVVSFGCGNVSLSSNHPSPIFPFGVTTIIWTATDECGHVVTCLQHVTRTQIQSTVCASPTNTIYTGTYSGSGGPEVGPLGPQSVTLSASPSGGTAPYQFLWSPSTGLSDTAGQVVEASPATTTTYTVTIIDAKGCSHIQTISVNVEPLSNIICGNTSAAQGHYKVQICHRPPGNPDNTQNICISISGLPSHLMGSGAGGHTNCYLGPCHNICAGNSSARVAFTQVSEEAEAIIVVTETKLNVQPNPAGKMTAFNFTVAEKGRVRIELYNAIGQNVALVFDGEVQANIVSRVNFDSSILPGGMYFYRMKTSAKVLTGKLLISK